MLRKFSNEKPIAENRPPILNGLELDALSNISNCIGGVRARHRFHSTSCSVVCRNRFNGVERL
jgi:hypothetical protein